MVQLHIQYFMKISDNRIHVKVKDPNQMHKCLLLNTKILELIFLSTIFEIFVDSQSFLSENLWFI